MNSGQQRTELNIDITSPTTHIRNQSDGQKIDEGLDNQESIIVDQSVNLSLPGKIKKIDSSFNCHAPVKPNKGQLPLMCEKDNAESSPFGSQHIDEPLPAKIMEISGSGNQSSSLCRMNSPQVWVAENISSVQSKK